MEITATTPNYTLLEAAMFTRLSLSTLRYWTRGRGGTPPVIRPTDALLSLVNLVEVHMVSMFRGLHRVPLQRIRRAITVMARRFPGEAHPLATRKFWTDGRDIFTQHFHGHYESLIEPGQMAFTDVVECYAQRVRWSGGLPDQLFPWTVNRIAEASADNLRRSVVIDPGIAFGRSVIAGTRVTTKAIKDLWDVGTELREIAEEFDVTPLQVEDAVRLEERRPVVRRAG
jgi:uncharacterized protein (DUF433 family)